MTALNNGYENKFKFGAEAKEPIKGQKVTDILKTRIIQMNGVVIGQEEYSKLENDYNSSLVNLSGVKTKTELIKKR
jgi:hypothetical protein